MELAMYKGQGGWFNKAIRFWTKSDYSHCEIIINGTWYSSSHTDGGVRSRVISGESGNWDIYVLDGEEYLAELVFDMANGLKYDWFGIVFSQILPFGLQANKRYFCSELCGHMLGIKDPQRLAPHELFKYLKDNGKIGVKLN